LDFAGFAVHQFGSTHDFAAERRADGLMSQTHSQHRHIARKMADQFNADSGLLRRARPGREQNPLGVHRLYVGNGELIVPAHQHVGAQFAQILDQVVGEGIVVVEDEDHGCPANPGYPNPGITEGIENGPASGLTDDTFKVRP
jgi:hypothetical protein